MEAELQMADHLDDRQFHLAIRRLADSLSYGSDRSPFLGAGLEYVQSRLYQAGDPIKSIDWRVTARTGKVHLKEYEAPKRMPMYLLLDTSASMCVASHYPSKYGWAVLIAGGLALAALARVSPVGILGCGQRELSVRPSLSRVQVFRWLHQLRRYRFDEQTTLAQRLREFSSTAENRSVVFVLSDLHSPEVLTELKPIAQKHDCIVLHFYDPAEQGQLKSGIIRAQEAETGRAFVAHGLSRWFSHDWLAHELKQSGIDHLVLSIQDRFMPHLRAFLRKRDCLGRGTR